MYLYLNSILLFVPFSSSFSFFHPPCSLSCSPPIHHHHNHHNFVVDIVLFYSLFLFIVGFFAVAEAVDISIAMLVVNCSLQLISWSFQWFIIHLYYTGMRVCLPLWAIITIESESKHPSPSSQSRGIFNSNMLPYGIIRRSGVEVER